MNLAVIVLKNVCKYYKMGEEIVKALDDVTLEIEKGSFTSIMGPSGSGKSTLMNIIGCLDVPTSGTYILDGMDTSKMDDDQLSMIRNRKIGFVFQYYNLLPKLTAIENVELPLIYAGVPKSKRLKAARELLESMGMGSRLYHYPSQLSGGQQQRVAIARALVVNPEIILADEPTGNLDSRSGEEVMKILSMINEKEKKTIVLITHDMKIANYARNLIKISDGKIVGQEETYEKYV
ncbi:putative ABC transport system ATP-binding protein [Caldanaerobius fijiensis DSM 17918]|uniref:Putative ABC transport system ATP-binding protein n=1 Tax=Caldanaerobius fijiensis DSM 17918 TaxID=1121256 RepID=A0A1M5D7L6_9THEO|nr:ABC transporter ATP-binding protein [Caldanaerobius fijiensis]SHF62941.1 putative ABC transport system ATP-binding protein [Caldanaerobius fijiensis DSM 17918]